MYPVGPGVRPNRVADCRDGCRSPMVAHLNASCDGASLARRRFPDFGAELPTLAHQIAPTMGQSGQFAPEGLRGGRGEEGGGELLMAERQFAAPQPDVGRDDHDERQRGHAEVEPGQ